MQLNAVEHTNFFENRATEYAKASTQGLLLLAQESRHISTNLEKNSMVKKMNLPREDFHRV